MGLIYATTPSYIWCSIFASHVLVIRGQRWIIGNGKNIAVWKDPWLIEEDNSYVSSERVHGMENMKVAYLINIIGTS